MLRARESRQFMRRSGESSVRERTTHLCSSSSVERSICSNLPVALSSAIAARVVARVSSGVRGSNSTRGRVRTVEVEREAADRRLVLLALAEGAAIEVDVVRRPEDEDALAAAAGEKAASQSLLRPAQDFSPLGERGDVHVLDVDAAVGEGGGRARVRVAGVPVREEERGQHASPGRAREGGDARCDDGLAALDGHLGERVALGRVRGGLEPGRELVVELAACGRASERSAASSLRGRREISTHCWLCTTSLRARLCGSTSEAWRAGRQVGRSAGEGGR